MITKPPTVSDTGAAADKLKTRQKNSKPVKQKYWQKEGYSQEDHKNNLTAGLSVFSKKPGSAAAADGAPQKTGGPMDIFNAIQDRETAKSDKEKGDADVAYQREMMARLRQLTEGS